MQKRLLFDELHKQLTHKNALVITGMRQVGKTTLMRQLYEEITAPKLWYDLDNPLDQKIFESPDYAGIYRYLASQLELKNQRLTICLDEVQNLPQVTKVIKYLLDHYGVKFILTGSSSFYLKHLFPESLAGRKFLYELPPLTFREILYFKGLLTREQAKSLNLEENSASCNHLDYLKRVTYYEEYLTYGGFPEVVATADIPTKQLVLKNIFASFFEKDLQLLSDYKDIRELRDLILLLVPRVGSMLDISKLASELGVERSKIYNYLEFLQGTFFIRLIPKFSESIDRAVAGGKKLYFADTGLLTVLGGASAGQLLENALINQLASYGKISFYNQRNTAEIDAIIDKKVAIEIKLHGTPSDLKKLQKYSGLLSIKKSWIMTQAYVTDSNFTNPHFI